MDEERKQGTYNFETICIPPVDKRKSNANYGFLDEKGLVKKRVDGKPVYVNKGDVIIGKVLTKSNKNGDEELFDCSYVIKSGEEGFIDRVLETVTPNGYKMIKVTIRNQRIPEIGDKLACYDKETEVLTKDGWIYIENVKLSDKVACLVDGKKLEYHNPIEVQNYDYDGKMYSIETKKISLLVTPNHRMYTGNCHRNNYNMKRADEIYGEMRSYKNSITEHLNQNFLKTFILPAYGDLQELELDLEAWCVFFGIWIAEGSCSISYYETGGVHSRQVSIAANKDRVKKSLNECMEKLGLKYNYHRTKGELAKFYSGDLRLIYYLHPLSVGAINKSLPDWCFNLDIKHSRKLIEGMILGDGCYMKKTTTERYYTSSIKLRDDFQRLCFHAGWGCNYYLKSEKGTKSICLGKEIATNADYWSLTICKTQTNPLVNKYIKENKQQDKWVDFKDKVYCCTVPTDDGIIFVRRNGKSIWCGQSRSAQKGTCGMIYPQEDMPFSASGLSPDILINSLCIPSRMTISQLLETCLGKSCCVEGTLGDATPFSSNSSNVAEQICDRLQRNGYERHGWEQLYNGMTGEVIEAQIFFGPVFYQRLKHMVSDKIHCCAIDTEVLTFNGWKKASDLRMNDHIATLKDGKLVYDEPIDIMFYPDYEGSMYYIKNQAVDLAVTGNHRMWVSKFHRRNQTWKPYEFARADEIIGKHLKYKKDAIWENDDYQFVLPKVRLVDGSIIKEKNVVMNDWLTFIGILYSQNSFPIFNNSKSEIVKFKFRDLDNDNYLLLNPLCKFGFDEEINSDEIFFFIYLLIFFITASLCDDVMIFVGMLLCFMGITLSMNKSDVHFTLENNPQLYKYLKTLHFCKELPEWVLKLSKDQTRVLIKGMLLGNDEKNVYYTSSVKLADQFQQLCLHAGWAGIVSTHLKAGEQVKEIRCKEVVNKYDVLRISVMTKRMNPTVNQSCVNNVDEQEEERFVEKEKCPVFCLQVPSEVFYIRRNGKACWTGNSRSQGHVTTLTRSVLLFIFIIYPSIIIH